MATGSGRTRGPAAGGGPPALRLWTVQRRGAWELALRRGVLRGDGRRVWRDFRPAYRWMRRKMALRAPGPRRAGRVRGSLPPTPVWAWFHARPDLRRAAHLPRGAEGVLVEFLAPRDRVLLSDFDAWHCVLNGGYLALSEADSGASEARHGGRARPGERSAVCRAAIEASWERIFDLLGSPEAGGPRDSWGHSGVVQAVIGEVPLRAVVRVTPFVAR